MDFDLFLPVGDMIFLSDDSGTIDWWLLGLDRIFKLTYYHFTCEMLELEGVGRNWIVGALAVDSFDILNYTFDNNQKKSYEVSDYYLKRCDRFLFLRSGSPGSGFF